MRSLLIAFSILALALPQARAQTSHHQHQSAPHRENAMHHHREKSSHHQGKAAPSVQQGATYHPNTPPGVQIANFGKSQSNVPIKLYTLTNSNGISVNLTNYGATLVNLWVPDRRGKFEDIVLGYDSLTPYFTNSPYFGATVGRYANRIARGELNLNGITYPLPINNGPNSLHGGKVGFNKRIWAAQIVSRKEPAVVFSMTSPDGDQGYPGALQTWVTFMLNNQNELVILYEATTHRPTVLNLTNHSYFNLAGEGNGKVLHSLVRINASRYTPTDAHLIPTGEIRSVAGTPFDFRTLKPIGASIHQTGGNPIGYDNNFVLNKPLFKQFGFAAEVIEPNSGRTLQVFTDQPGIQFYTANFLNGTIKGKGGKKYPQYGAFCLETQHFPDSPHQARFPSTVLYPGDTFRSVTVYKFGVR